MKKKDTKKAKKSNSFFTKFFFFSTLFISLVFICLLLVVFFLWTPLKQINIVPQISEVFIPRQEDYWSVQEKRLDESKEGILLTPPEFNAWLSNYSFIIYGPFCLHRIRFVPGNKTAMFQLIGSGFFKKTFFIQVELLKDNADLRLASININSWSVPKSKYLYQIILKNLVLLFDSLDYNPIREFYAQKLIFDFKDKEILIKKTL